MTGKYSRVTNQSYTVVSISLIFKLDPVSDNYRNILFCDNYFLSGNNNENVTFYWRSEEHCLTFLVFIIYNESGMFFLVSERRL